MFILFGLFFGVQSLGMEIGTAFRMGPGYFPLVLAGVLILLGGLILFNALKDRGPKRWEPSPGAGCCSSCPHRSSLA